MQPGWFAGHATALMYLNIWLGLDPDNYATLWPMFEILGPSDNPYPGTICLPQISLPNGLTPSSGDFATIQVVQTLKSGASLFSVSFGQTQYTNLLSKQLTCELGSVRISYSRTICPRFPLLTRQTVSTPQVSRSRVFKS